MFLIPFVSAFVGLLLFFIYLNYSLTFKRALYVRKMRDFHTEWSDYLSVNFSYYNFLNADLKKNLIDKISIFYNEKSWPIGCEENQKIQTSAMACLPIVNRKSNFYPQIKKDFLSLTQEDWFAENEIQFEKEVGKMPLREFGGDFVKYSIEYFQNYQQLKNSNKRFFDLLNYYYKLSC